MSDNEVLQLIHEDVKDIKAALNGPMGLVAEVQVLKASDASRKRHFTYIWGAIVALTTTLMRIIWK